MAGSRKANCCAGQVYKVKGSCSQALKAENVAPTVVFWAWYHLEWDIDKIALPMSKDFCHEKKRGRKTQLYGSRGNWACPAVQAGAASMREFQRLARFTSNWCEMLKDKIKIHRYCGGMIQKSLIILLADMSNALDCIASHRVKNETTVYSKRLEEHCLNSQAWTAGLIHCQMTFTYLSFSLIRK